LKRALTKYNENKKIKKDLEDRLEEAENKFYGLKGGGIAKMPEGSPPDAGLVIAVKLECIDKIRADLRRVNGEIEEVDNFIAKMSDYKSLIEDKFMNEISGEELADKYGYSSRHINRLIDRVILTNAMIDDMDKM